jgi:hypothetical protein
MAGMARSAVSLSRKNSNEGLARRTGISRQQKGGVMNSEASIRLRQRREVAEMTLLYVENERREIDTSVDCFTETAYRHRAWLLDQLTAWYRAELRDLDRAIGELATTES